MIDNLSGLLGHASVAISRAGLAKRGLTLNVRAKRLTWKVPAPGTPGGSDNQATASFRAQVSAAVAQGTKLTTAASPQGGTCSAGQPCATTLTVADAPSASTAPTAAAPTASTPSAMASTATTTPPTTASPTAPDRTPATARSPATITGALPDACTRGTIFNVNGLALGAAASPLVGNIYELNTATGQNTQIGRFFDGTAASSVGLNGLAVEPNLSAAYAVTQNGGGTIWTHLRNGTNSSQSAGSAAAPGVQMIMGGLDPANGIYYYAGYTGSGAGLTLGIWGYDPALTGSARVLGRLVNISFANTGFSTGDLAFDASGNMFIVAGTNSTTSVNTSQIRRVNGPLPDTSRPTPLTLPSTTLTENEAGPVGTGFYNGIAFASDGTLYAQYATTGTATLVDLNPNNGTIISTTPQTGVPDSGILTDLAGCSLP
ncbi:MAG: hypothetical protein J2P32_17025, partial [Actinobacteria bacterium]|nr:hypothetical protein [Actinomycetota bacterium]